MKHIYLDKSFFIFLLVIILTGNFNGFIPFFALLLIHEFGHTLIGILLGYKLDKIMIYPYGGVTKFNLPLNIAIKKELIILFSGPLFQIIGYFILGNFFSDIKIYHYTLLLFNLLPIYPLDGGKIINCLFGYFYNYLKCFYITFFTSIIFLIFLVTYNIVHFNLNFLLMIIFLFFELLKFYRLRFFYYNRFLLERHIKNLSFKKIKEIDGIKKFYRDTFHYVNYQDEKKVLKNYFKSL